MKIPESKIKFICGLSNGETLIEGKGVLSKVEGELSPWWKLQKYLTDKDLRIHSFNLWIGDRHYNLPSFKPKFGGEVPIAYNCFRKMASDVMGGDESVEHYICAEAVYADYTVQTWIDETDCNKSWINIVNRRKYARRPKRNKK